jgi:hypothetical protein
MIGSISKIRPCGHHHYYKYAHATEGRHPEDYNGKKYDMYQVSREYWKDVDEDDCWNFSLENAKSLTHCCFELGRFTKFKSKTPKLTNAYCMFTGDNGKTSPYITEIEMDYDNLTNVTCLFYGFNLKELPPNFNPKTRNFEYMLTSSVNNIANANGGVFPFYEILNEAVSTKSMFTYSGDYAMDDRYTFEDVTNAQSMFYINSNVGINHFPANLSFKNVTTISDLCFNGGYNRHNRLAIFQTKDTMSKLKTMNRAFYNAYSLYSLYPDYDSFSLPSLTNASECFYGCILDRASIIKLSNALPDWSNDTAAHNITIGCHIDNKFNPEVNIALKKLNHNYVTPIEENGEALPETITSSKNWALAVQWNGAENGSIDEIIDNTPLELDTIRLPENYTRCEYLEDTGTQFIDTGYVPTNTTGIYGFAKQLIHTNSYFAGSGEETSNTRFTAPIWLKHTANTCGFGWRTWTSYGQVGDGKSFESYLNYKNDRIAKLCHRGSVTKTNNLGNLNFTPTRSIYMFKTNHDKAGPWMGRIYRVKISEGSEVIRDFIPCLNADGVPCMRDIINGVDYTNDGEGIFRYKIHEN